MLLIWIVVALVFAVAEVATSAFFAAFLAAGGDRRGGSPLIQPGNAHASAGLRCHLAPRHRGRPSLAPPPFQWTASRGDHVRGNQHDR